MFRDFIIGQYYPADSVIHRLDPRVKLLGTLLFLIMVFLIRDIPCFILVTAFLCITIALSKVPLRRMLRGLRAILTILVLTFLFSLFLTPGDMIFAIGPAKATQEGLRIGVFMLMRLSYLIIGSSVMTLTTTPNALTDGIETGLGFLKKLHIPVHEIALMMSIALRFIPILMEELDRIMKAQKARGADFESGSLVRRVKSLVPIIVPLFVSAIRRADDLAMAMDARCYHGGEGRTKMKPLKMHGRDWAAMAVVIVVFAAVIVLRQ